MGTLVILSRVPTGDLVNDYHILLVLLVNVHADRRVSLSVLAACTARRAVVIVVLGEGFMHFSRVAHARVSALIVEHLSALTLLIRADMADKISRLEDVLAPNHHLAELVRRIAGSCIDATVVFVHLLLNMIRFVRLVDALVQGAAIDVRGCHTTNLLEWRLIEGRSDQLLAVLVGDRSDPG